MMVCWLEGSATTATGRKTSRFMKLNIALVYDEAMPGADHVEGRRLYLRDSFQDYLRQLTERDLQGSHGLATMKNELLRRARVGRIDLGYAAVE